jgi:hypothetical protein
MCFLNASETIGDSSLDYRRTRRVVCYNYIQMSYRALRIITYFVQMSYNVLHMHERECNIVTSILENSLQNSGVGLLKIVEGISLSFSLSLSPPPTLCVSSLLLLHTHTHTHPFSFFLSNPVSVLMRIVFVPQ